MYSEYKEINALGPVTNFHIYDENVLDILNKTTRYSEWTWVGNRVSAFPPSCDNISCVLHEACIPVY